MKALTKLQKSIIEFIQGDIPCAADPYAGIAEKNKVDPAEIVRQIKILKKGGYIRRFGAILAHKQVGMKANCMCVWVVPENKVDIIAKTASRLPQISHCYLRKTIKNWPYNFYTMIHGKTKKECEDTVDLLVRRSGVREYRMLFTKKQFKKTSPHYRV